MVETAAGGHQGGGAFLTQTGEKVIQLYRCVEKLSETAGAAEIKLLFNLLAKPK